MNQMPDGTPKFGPLGLNVVYVGESGKPKAATILGTHESVQEGTTLPTLAEGYAHLLVHGIGYEEVPINAEQLAIVAVPTHSLRLSVPRHDVVENTSEFKDPETGLLLGVWYPN